MRKTPTPKNFGDDLEERPLIVSLRKLTDEALRASCGPADKAQRLIETLKASEDPVSIRKIEELRARMDKIARKALADAISSENNKRSIQGKQRLSLKEEHLFFACLLERAFNK